ncbi:unnamed protein product, partial [Amoebophrya sp. A120]|eukprot:GSA120T00014661001.1
MRRLQDEIQAIQDAREEAEASQEKLTAGRNLAILLKSWMAGPGSPFEATDYKWLHEMTVRWVQEGEQKKAISAYTDFTGAEELKPFAAE